MTITTATIDTVRIEVQVENEEIIYADIFNTRGYVKQEPINFNPSLETVEEAIDDYLEDMKEMASYYA